MAEIQETKLAAILRKRKLSQTDLINLIYLKKHRWIGKDRISKLCTGKSEGITLSTAKLIAESLGVRIDKIID